MERFEYVNATTLADALAQVGNGRELKAGGIDLLDRMKEGLSSPQRVVSIRNVAALSGVKSDANGLTIGPLTTLAELAEDKNLKGGYHAIAAAAVQIATPQIRNMATAGGNLLQRPRCWYFRNAETACLRKSGDTCFAQNGANRYHAIFNNDICAMVQPSGLSIPLTAFEATLELTGAKGVRTIPIADFYLSPDVDPTREYEIRPDEILTAIRVPAVSNATRSAYKKQKEKESSDWPLVDVAVVVDLVRGSIRRASIVLGAVAAKPYRVVAAEDELKGGPVNDRVLKRAAAAAVAGAKPLAGNAYKVQVLEAVVRRTIEEAVS